jgi:hypothetical protein
LKRLLAIAFVFLGCAGNSPSYIPPIPSYHETQAVDAADAVTYRTLTRADFKATRPPGDGKGIPAHASAALVGSLRMVPEAEWVFKSIETEDGPMVEATANKLRFQAIMLPEQSWWNEELDSSLTAYVLAHEQVHFAIFELEARSMNARIDEIVAHVRSVAPTIEEAQRKAEERLNEIRRASDKKMQERQEDYERETANGKLRHRQEEWERRIRLELANTAWRR